MNRRLGKNIYALVFLAGLLASIWNGHAFAQNTEPQTPASPEEIQVVYTLPPYIDDMTADLFIPELGISNLAVLSATDPYGGNLTYSWTPLDGGSIIGNGPNVLFDPPDSGPYADPYRIEFTLTSDVSGLQSSEILEIHVKKAGDANGDGMVDQVDTDMISQHLGQVEGDGGWDIRADMNSDGAVTVLDEQIVLNNFGSTGGCDHQAAFESSSSRRRNPGLHRIQSADTGSSGENAGTPSPVAVNDVAEENKETVFDTCNSNDVSSNSCHSGLDPESSPISLDSSIRGNDASLDIYQVVTNNIDIADGKEGIAISSAHILSENSYRAYARSLGSAIMSLPKSLVISSEARGFEYNTERVFPVSDVLTYTATDGVPDSDAFLKMHIWNDRGDPCSVMMIDDIGAENGMVGSGMVVLTIKARGSCGDELTYTWKPLNGGSITGSGPRVQFIPPADSTHDSVYQIEVTITADRSGLELTEIIQIHAAMLEVKVEEGVINPADRASERGPLEQQEDNPGQNIHNGQGSEGNTIMEKEEDNQPEETLQDYTEMKKHVTQKSTEAADLIHFALLCGLNGSRVKSGSHKKRHNVFK
jgi:hypothetical protein